jgi:hypothetical protein
MVGAMYATRRTDTDFAVASKRSSNSSMLYSVTAPVNKRLKINAQNFKKNRLTRQRDQRINGKQKAFLFVRLCEENSTPE